MAASRSPQLRLLHIRDEIDGVSAAINGVGFEDWRKSYALRRVSERALQIISEAARALPVELTERYPAAPWSAIIGIGNILRHEYQHIDDQRLWEIVTVHLPLLHGVVLQMLSDREPS
ncbi:MAG TPA: HepT-like ribonuclease domain-containing protein [Pseudolabrys sp.]